MEKLNILMVHPHDIYSAKEPWTIRITSIAKEFSRLGHSVKLVYFPLDKAKRGVLRPKYLGFETIPYFRRRIDIPSNIIKMTKLAKWADVVHLQKCYPEAVFPAIVSSFLAGKPLHYDWDDWEYKIYVLPSPTRRPILKTEAAFLKLLENSIPKLADSISVASDELRNMSLKLGVRKDRIIKVSVCADLDRFNPSNRSGGITKKYGLKKPLVTYLGQLHGAQYAELFLKSAAIVLSREPETQFLVIGGGDDLGRLKKASEKLDIGKNVRFTGFIQDKDVDLLLAATDIAVASFVDTLQQRCKSPLKIAEYMACGKPVVASNVGEVPWMLGDAGILCRQGDPDDMAEGIVQLLEDPEMRRTLGAKARKRAELIFDWNKAARLLLETYTREIIRAKRTEK